VGRPRPAGRMLCRPEVDECILLRVLRWTQNPEAAAELHSFAIRSVEQNFTDKWRGEETDSSRTQIDLVGRV